MARDTARGRYRERYREREIPRERETERERESERERREGKREREREKRGKERERRNKRKNREAEYLVELKKVGSKNRFFLAGRGSRGGASTCSCTARRWPCFIGQWPLAAPSTSLVVMHPS